MMAHSMKRSRLYRMTACVTLLDAQHGQLEFLEQWVALLDLHGVEETGVTWKFSWKITASRYGHELTLVDMKDSEGCGS